MPGRAAIESASRPDSIVLSLTQVLDGFSGVPALRGRFGISAGDRPITVDQVFGGISWLGALIKFSAN